MLGRHFRSALRAAADPAKAAPMAAYMKHKQKFLGVSSPARAAAVKAALEQAVDGVDGGSSASSDGASGRSHRGPPPATAAALLVDKAVWEATIKDLWSGEFREERYVALDLLDYGGKRSVGHLAGEADLPLLRHLLAGCDHWDTLDTLATGSFAAVVKTLSSERRREVVREVRRSRDCGVHRVRRWVWAGWLDGE